MVTGGKIGTTGKAGQRAARKARLAAALRQNLKRRKQQARERAVLGETSSEDGEERAPAAGTPDFRRNPGGE